MDKIKATSSRERAHLAERRQSHRVHIAMPILVRGRKGADAFEERTRTISVSAHGCMIHMTTPVTRSQELTLVNTKTAEELPCTVTFLGQKVCEQSEVGIKFNEPSPVFWRIAFPPEEWDPSERKRPSQQDAKAPKAHVIKR
jgi:PilZ domain